MKAYRGVEVTLYRSLLSAVDGNGCYATRSRRFTPEKGNPSPSV